jgi:hypothetical protein
MQAGGECWIPKNPGAVSVEQVIGQSGGLKAGCRDAWDALCIRHSAPRTHRRRRDRPRHAAVHD